jgi:hypothetical protein
MSKRRTAAFRLLLAVGAACFLLLPGCSSPVTPPPGTPLPETPTAVPWVLPTPSTGTGVVAGVVLDSATGAAPESALLYLGELVYMDTGIPIVRLDRRVALTATLGTDGHFVFPRVAPGKYGLVLGSADASLLLADPKDGQSLLLDVSAGQTKDIGLIEAVLP